MKANHEEPTVTGIRNKLKRRVYELKLSDSELSHIAEEIIQENETKNETKNTDDNPITSQTSSSDEDKSTSSSSPPSDDERNSQSSSSSDEEEYIKFDDKSSIQQDSTEHVTMLDTSLNDIKQKQTELCEKISTFMSKYKPMLLKINDAHDIIKIIDNYTHEMYSDISSLKFNCEVCEKELTDLTNKFDDYKSHTLSQSSNKQIEALQEQNNILVSENERMKQESNENLTFLKNKLLEIENSSDELRKQVQTSTSEDEHLRNLISTLTEENKSLEDKVSSLRNENMLLTSNINEYKNRIISLLNENSALINTLYKMTVTPKPN